MCVSVCISMCETEEANVKVLKVFYPPPEDEGSRKKEEELKKTLIGKLRP